MRYSLYKRETCIKAQRGRTNGKYRRWLFPYFFVGTFIEA